MYYHVGNTVIKLILVLSLNEEFHLIIASVNMSFFSPRNASNHKKSVDDDDPVSDFQFSSPDTPESSTDLTNLRSSPVPSPTPIVAQNNSEDKETTLDNTNNKKKTTKNGDEETRCPKTTKVCILVLHVLAEAVLF